MTKKKEPVILDWRESKITITEKKGKKKGEPSEIEVTEKVEKKDRAKKAN